MAIVKGIGSKLSGLSLCARLSAVTVVLALVAALGVAAYTGERAGLWLAGAIALFAGVNIALWYVFGRGANSGDCGEADKTC
jgi:hypothetical protein